MSFWTNLETAIEADVKAAEAEIVKIATAIKPLLIASAEELGNIALQAVLTQATSVVSGQEKLNAAVSTVVTTLATAGKAVAVSTAEAAVQVAYNTVSASLTPSK